MENLHAVTIPSDPTSAGKYKTGVITEDLTFSQLQAKKDNLESEIRALGGVLDSHNVDMKTPLLTLDGYPRADLDVALIRTTRARINYLVNDLKDLMNIIEKRIHDHFAQIAKDGISEEPSLIREKPEPCLASKQIPYPQESLPPFAKVNSVVENSPAASAGLQIGDLIKSFSYVNITNHDGLKRLSECVQGNKDKDIILTVLRPLDSLRRKELTLTLRPTQNWGGKGLIGCHILPY
ncbi:putative 26s proteasome non-atpase regulatory subunit 9 [Erysiphe necator]|uniref:Probable 26S proteasome regulatory subunit p27 n=1 Tax=Uncinula necator TaxID=52586 RepID=A0A0B1P7D1_UNCNE|nr:putative 26s proteasome non-atpase regulatory subunit 9 [Erysiphe necator]